MRNFLLINNQTADNFRDAATPLAKWLVKHHVKPDWLTWLGFILAAWAGFIFSKGHFGWAGLVAGFSGLLDVLDGLVARQSLFPSAQGVVLDSVLDRYSDFFPLAGLSIFFHHQEIVVLVCLFALLGSFMVSYATAKAEALRLEGPTGSMKRQERWVILIIGAWLSPAFHSTVPMIAAVSIISVLANLSAGIRLYDVWTTAHTKNFF